MKKLGIKSIVIKKYKYSKNQGKVPDNKENILNQDFKADTGVTTIIKRREDSMKKYFVK